MAEDTQLLDLEEAARKVSASKKQKETRAKRKELIKQGEAQKYAYAFKYADGRVVSIKTNAKAILALGLPLISQDTAIKTKKNSRGSGEHAEVVRSVLQKPLRYSLISRVNKKTKKYEREWRTIAIPKDAKLLDILANIKQWATKPEMVRINNENILVKSPTGAAFKAAAAKTKAFAKVKALLPPTKKAN
jgi:hypothetical protein